MSIKYFTLKNIYQQLNVVRVNEDTVGLSVYKTSNVVLYKFKRFILYNPNAMASHFTIYYGKLISTLLFKISYILYELSYILNKISYIHISYMRCKIYYILYKISY